MRGILELLEISFFDIRADPKPEQREDGAAAAQWRVPKKQPHAGSVLIGT